MGELINASHGATIGIGWTWTAAEVQQLKYLKDSAVRLVGTTIAAPLSFNHSNGSVSTDYVWTSLPQQEET